MLAAREAWDGAENEPHIRAHHIGGSIPLQPCYSALTLILIRSASVSEATYRLIEAMSQKSLTEGLGPCGFIMPMGATERPIVRHLSRSRYGEPPPNYDPNAGFFGGDQMRKFAGV